VFIIIIIIMGEDVRETDVLHSSVAADGGDRRLPGVGGRAAGCRPVPGGARRHRSAHPVDPERRRRLTPARAAAVVAAQSSQSTVSNMVNKATSTRVLAHGRLKTVSHSRQISPVYS